MADENLNGQVVLPLHVAVGSERVTIVLWNATHRLVDDAEVRILVSYTTKKMGQLMAMSGMGIALPPIVAKSIGLGFYQANVHDKIMRTVTKLPNGIRTMTESDDPHVAQYLKDHVARMDQRLKDGNVFNVASHTLPTFFANNAKIHTEIQQTARGVIFTQTSNDPTTIAALQAHAEEVSDLAREGMVALQRSLMTNVGPMDSGAPMISNGTAQGQMGPGMMGRQGMMNGGGPMMMAQMRQMMMQGGGPMGNMQGHVPAMMQGQSLQAGPPAQTTP